jgi:hypothetical protein
VPTCSKQPRQQCLAGQSRAAQALAERGALADGLTKASAPDIIYTLMSLQVHQILTAERHWNADQYEHWLARSLQPHSCHPPIPDNHDNTRSGGLSYIAGATERPSHPGRRFSPGR